MIGFPLGLLYANAGEWLLHKHVLHGMGKHKNSSYNFHWHEHHREARKHAMFDPSYERSLFGWHAQSKEALGLVGLALAHLPLLPIAPFFTAAVWYSTWRYYHVHKRAHLDPAWAREHLPWHVDHHLGPNQHANWCVTWPLFDIIMGTCEPFIESDHPDRKVKEVRRPSTRASAVTT